MNFSIHQTLARRRRWSRPHGLRGALRHLLACLGLPGPGPQRTGPSAPVVPQPSAHERWQHASALLNDVALQSNQLALRALVELERSEAGSAERAQLAGQLRQLARHSAESARAVRAAGPPALHREAAGRSN